jgi:uncharacterized OB-fold protein
MSTTSAGASFYRVSDRGHGIAAYTPPPRAQRRRREADPPAVAVVRAAPEAAVKLALHIAGGDPSRLRFNADGSVTVANGPRT